MPVSVVLHALHPKRLMEKGRRGKYRIHRSVFEDNGIDISPWLRHKEEVKRKAAAKKAADDAVKAEKKRVAEEAGISSTAEAVRRRWNKTREGRATGSTEDGSDARRHSEAPVDAADPDVHKNVWAPWVEHVAEMVRRGWETAAADIPLPKSTAAIMKL